MKRTVKLYQPEHYEFADGTVLDRSEVAVAPFGKAWDGSQGRERTVWADADDDSCLYVIKSGLLWQFDGDIL